MNRLFLLCLLLLGVAVYSDATFLVKVTNGEIIVSDKQIGKKTISDSINIENGDSLFLASEHQATIVLEKNSKILCKGPLTAVLMTENSGLKLILDEGQVFLDRNLPYEYSSVQITTRGYCFQPLGTAAAVKTSKSSNPATAVVRGKMKMQAPTGESIIVDEGNFGSVDQNGNLTSGKLTEQAVASLIDWGHIDNSSDTTTNVETKAVAPVVATVAVTENQPATSSIDSVQPVMPVNAQSVNEIKPAVSPQKDDSTVSKGQESNNQEIKSEAKPEKIQEKKNTTAVPSTAPQQTTWEINAGTATVNDKQWTRIAVGADVPIWKFGVFFDVELFIDDKGKVSNKGWDFKDEPLDAISRKIRYIRFGHEEDPLFIKFGGLSSVTLGYGFLVDRFTNMLHYPDQKLLGLQCNLNDIGPLGITLQTVLADFKDFENDGAVVAARLAFTPLKMSPIPIVKGITFGGTYAVDINQYAPARDWDIDVSTSMREYRYFRNLHVDSAEAVDSAIAFTGKNPISDSITYAKEKKAAESNDQFGLIGGDVGIPLIRSSLVSLDLYGQAGIREDLKHGWGIGVPGLALKLWKLWANVEYRRVQGRFAPGYFGMYYLDERLQRIPEIITKEESLIDDELNGIFGRLGFNIANVLIIDGAYQYMIGKKDDSKDQRFEITSSIGDLIVKRIPKLTKAEIYYQKTRIGSTVVSYNQNSGTYEYDSFFEKTPFMYWGYRLGIGIAPGASLIFDSRFGFKRGGDGYKMEPDNNISIQTAITF